MEHKTCSACKSVLPIFEFHNSKSGKFGKANACKSCARRRATAHYYEKKGSPVSEARKAYLRGKRYEYQYGITLEKYGEMLAEQGGVCAICKGEPAGRATFSVDHDHVSGAVRGLLCQPCNLILGHAGDDVERLRAAIVYLGG